MSSSSYLSWLESVNSEYFETVISNEPGESTLIILTHNITHIFSNSDHDVDNKVGEWNNFWLNYSNSRLCQLSTEQTFSSDGIFDKTVDDQSEERKSLSTQRDVTEKNSLECVILTVDEVLQVTIVTIEKITQN